MAIVTLEKLDELEIRLKKDWLETIINIQNFLGNDARRFEVKKDIIRLVSEVFENSLRLIEEERKKGSNESDLKEAFNG